MASHSKEMFSKNNQPGTKIGNVRADPGHAVPKLNRITKPVNNSGPILVPGTVGNNKSDSPPSPSLPLTSGKCGEGSDNHASADTTCGNRSDMLPPTEVDCNKKSGSTTRYTDNASRDPTSSFRMALNLPGSDTEPSVSDQDFTIFNLHFDPAQTPQPQTPPQPNAPSEQPQRPFSHFMNVVGRLLNFHGNNDDPGSTSSSRSGNGGDNGSGDDHSNDGDDEDNNDNDYSSPVSPGAEPSTNPSPATVHNPSTPSGPITRSQTKDWIAQVTFLATTSTHTPSNKRKRGSSIDLPSSITTKGDRASKRIRNSFSDSLPLPEPQDLKRTRGLQKKFEAKLGKDHVFDPQHPGSVRRESVDAKSGAKGWRRESLHGEPWDGSKE